MKKIEIILFAGILAGLSSCKKSDFSDNYTDPAKIATSTVAKQFTGMIYTNREYVIPSYWNYFVVLRPTINRYNQAVGWQNVQNQYIPGAGLVSDRWNTFYNFLLQYREMQLLNSQLSTVEQTENRVYLLTGAIYFFDHTEKTVDLHGSIPWSTAGLIKVNGGDYANSSAKYDAAEDIYTRMLDSLKMLADELNTISIPESKKSEFKNQDIINNGDLEAWKMYCNSLRLRMLTRASSSSTFQARAASEIAEILADPTKYPIVMSNDDAIKIDIFDLTSPIKSDGFQSGLEDWDGNLAGSAMIDHMKTNADPRLRVLFQPGDSANGEYMGLDPMMDAAAQGDLIRELKISRYNRATVSRNDFFPGLLITAPEVSFLLAEYYLNAGNDAAAQTAYETGVKQSIEFYYWVNTLTNDNTASPELVPLDEAEITAYLAMPAINWSAAASTDAKWELLAREKWLHYNVVQPLENWAELRRLRVLDLSFEADNSNAQTLPPARWAYPGSELTYNLDNYQAVRDSDNINTRLFWDTK